MPYINLRFTYLLTYECTMDQWGTPLSSPPLPFLSFPIIPLPLTFHGSYPSNPAWGLGERLPQRVRAELGRQTVSGASDVRIAPLLAVSSIE